MEARLAQIITPMIEGMGFDLVRVRLVGAMTRSKTLQIMAERPDGTMNVEACAEVSRAISALLDVEDPIAGDYVLEVSSPGIDRPLVRPRDYERHLGHLAKIKLHDLLNGRKRFVGSILSVTEDAVVLELDEGPEKEKRTLAFDQIAEAKLVLTDRLVRQSLKKSGDVTA